MQSKTRICAAAVLGILVGGSVVQRHARACSCSPPGWTLELADDSPDGDEEGVWPMTLRLTASPGRITMTAPHENPAVQFNYLHASEP